jgi:hypothetical protein
MIDAPSIAKLLIKVLTRALERLERRMTQEISPRSTIMLEDMRELIKDLNNFINIE